MAEVKRATRVAERVRQELALLLNREVRDPGAQGVVVSRVEMTDDLKLVRVYVRMLSGEKSDAALKALGRASSMLRREVTRAVGLRYAPDFKFFYDSALDKQTRIDELLEEVKRERPKE